MSLGVNEEMPILRGNRLSTGIADLDMVLEGGYLNPGNEIIMGPSSIEKSALAYHFAASADQKENVYIICGGYSPNDIIEKATGIGLNLNRENIKFIDCYTATLGTGEIASTEKIKIVAGPSALNDISLAINEAITESTGKKMRVVFDTLSTFVLYNQKDSIRKFLNLIEGRLKGVGATTLYLVDDGVHDKQTISLMLQGMDAVYTIVDNGGKFSLTIPDLDMPVPIKVGPTGVVIL
ncbi:KaiC [Candidatus Bilamarchaeum dharawalense]|uniref:KaiC n=1 Tax=Candidatus Bilamarchaeum dharawalense TaxID=2885759 RepID=A0A5E4LP35_9ARCH|nr:KaiC [Candidatus Bilamarchaeum dharawalense]